MNNDYIYSYAEKKANKFNMYCLLVIAAFSILVIILTALGIFTQDTNTVIAEMISLFAVDIVPFVIYLINDIFMKSKRPIIENKKFKVIILVVTYLSIFEICSVFSFHAILLLAIPLLLAAQYRLKKSHFIILLVITLALVPIVTYGNYLNGIYDANLLKPLTEEQANLNTENGLANRINALTAKRALEVFLHYALPKMICIAVIGYVAYSITKRTSEMLSVQIDLSEEVNNEIRAKANLQKSVIENLADIIESRDIETGEHIKRTKKYVTILVEEMKNNEKYKDLLNDTYCENIINAAPLHDIGKIVVSDLILCKPGKLTDEEFDKMKIHTSKGGEIIRNILNDLGDEAFLNVAYDVATYHHEKWNGKGYPENLVGENIPLPARIMAIADVFDALVAERVYKKPMPVDKAIEIIVNDSGTHFDPNLVEIFKTVEDKFISASKEKL